MEPFFFLYWLLYLLRFLIDWLLDYTSSWWNMIMSINFVLYFYIRIPSNKLPLFRIIWNNYAKNYTWDLATKLKKKGEYFLTHVKLKTKFNRVPPIRLVTCSATGFITYSLCILYFFSRLSATGFITYSLCILYFFSRL